MHADTEGGAEFGLRRKAAGRRQDPQRLQHPKGSDITPRIASPRWGLKHYLIITNNINDKKLYYKYSIKQTTFGIPISTLEEGQVHVGW